MRKTDLSVQELVDMIERGELRLPEMQRQYVWRATRVRDLLDSLYRGYPSGTVLVWETDQQMPTRDLSITQKVSVFDGHKLLLDGQQRLTSLSAVIRGEPVRVRGRKRPIDILFNLEHPERTTDVVEVEEDDGDEIEVEATTLAETLRGLTFVVGNNKLAADPLWVSVTDVFKADSNTPFLKKAGVTAFDDPRYDKFNKRLERLRGVKRYNFTMQVLERDLSYSEVTEIFVRVNSLGAKLRSSDLAVAQITATWRNSLALFEKFANDLATSGFEVPLGILVRSLVVFATGQCRFDSVAKLSLERLQDGWDKAKQAMNFAIDFLQRNGGFEGASLLSSPMLVITVAYFASVRRFKLSTEEENELLLWLHVANGKGYYSGSTETKLDQDLAAIRDEADPHRLLANLRGKVGRLDFEAEDFQGKNQLSPLFKLMYIALKARGAKDWQTSLGISLSLRGGRHELQYHHIHPKATLKGAFLDKQINEIANFAFICGSTNRKIGKRTPADYFPEVIAKRGAQAFESQCIPLDEALLKTEGFPEFLSRRRELLSETVNGFLEQFKSGR